jgi:hypothetical protein
MKALNKLQTFELLKKGATIEFTTWGDSYPINIRLGDSWQQVHKSAFNSLARSGLIKRVAQDRLTQTWKFVSMTKQVTKNERSKTYP